ncbi:MAG: sodium/proline symporter [Ruminococcaceae bacterium]|nr:sodium/proline symporter [Oscillospiraceae bacterium]
MTTAQFLIIGTIIVYLLGMVLIGASFSKKNKNTDDFYLGGRKLGPLVTAMSAEASDMSSWLLMGLPGVALVYGLAEASWTAIGLGIGTWVNWFIVSKRIRNYTQLIDAVTIPEFFSKRFGDKKNLLSLIAGLVILVFFVPYTASGFNACGTLFASLFGVDYFTAMVISAIVIVLYTTLGGFLAASTTDLIQSIVMTIALVVVVGFGINYAGGWDSVVANANSMPGFLELFNTYDPATNASKPYNALTIASLLAWGLGYFGMPHILLRFMAINDKNKLKTSRRIATVWVFISMAIAILIGVIGSAVVKNGAVALENANSQRIIIEISKLISGNGAIFAILAGVILAGILAATMSTSDSQLLTAASAVSQNIVKEFFGKTLSQKASMIVARVTVVVIAVVGVIWAKDEGSVFEIVSFAWAGFGAAFGPVVLFALFWKRTNKWGALAGMIVGGVMIFVWKYVIAPLGGVFAIYELLPAFILASISIVLVSLITEEPDKEIQDTFEKAKAGLEE